MSLWFYELFAPETLARHLTMFLLAVAVLMPSVGFVRVVALVAGAVAVVAALTVVDDPVGLFWGALLVVLVLVRMVASSSRAFGVALSPEERLFHDQAVPSLSSGQVRKLLGIGQLREVVPGTMLTRAGEAVGELCFITRGQVDIIVDGAKVADCGPGTLIGELGMSTGEPATATAVCATPVRYLAFESARLYRLLDSHVDLQDAVELAIERSLRDKLNRANVATAHRRGNPVG
jgi:hypothetical protein